MHRSRLMDLKFKQMQIFIYISNKRKSVQIKLSSCKIKDNLYFFFSFKGTNHIR
jgi:hypothetical protein